MKFSVRTDVALWGVAITVAVVLADMVGVLGPLDRWLGDWRTQLCQVWRPPPANKLVHLDIDDLSLEAIGRWPWERRDVAAIIDEIERAKPKVVALDIIYAQQERPTLDDPAATQPVRVEGDPIFEKTVRAGGNVILPASVADEPQRLSVLGGRILEILTQRPELGPDDLAQELKRDTDPKEVDKEISRYDELRRKAIERRVGIELAKGATCTTDLCSRLHTPEAVNTVVTRLIREAYDKQAAVRDLQRFCIDCPPGVGPFLSTPAEIAPLPQFVQAAGGSGCVTYIPATDGRVRSIPLFVQLNGRLYPTLGLSIACKLLDAEVNSLRISNKEVRIPQTAGDIVIPIRPERVPFGTVGGMFQVPFFGDTDWQTMYDPLRKSPAQHYPATYVWDVLLAKKRIASNNKEIDAALRNLILGGTGSVTVKSVSSGATETIDDKSLPENVVAELARVNSLPPAKDDPDIRSAVIDQFINDYGFVVQGVSETEIAKAEDNLKQVFNSVKSLKELRQQNQAYKKEIQDRRNKLAGTFGGKAVLIGWTATALVDNVPTPLHSKCPGVVIHGLVTTAIMSQNWIVRAPPWVAIITTLFAGLVTTALVAWLPPIEGIAAATLVALSYTVFDGFIVYSRFGVMLDPAGPTVAGALAYTTCTLFRFIIERRERSYVLSKFSRYVDPKLVDYVMVNRAALAGERRELTVVFTDLQGFTTISERLGERTVTLLNEYFGFMVPLIRKYDGYVNKFLGDGIMFFFGAPVPDPQHARNAARSVLEMQKAVRDFNVELKERGLPEVKMRAGMVTGDMVVGDAGSPDASDYTVLGDNVNLASRLEGANKAFGTLVMAGQRTIDELQDEFLTRPIGRLQVVGKSECVMTHEIMCYRKEAAAQDIRRAEATARMVDAYVGGRFTRCLELIAEMERDFDHSKLTDLYRRMCDKHLEKFEPASFRGEIVLSEK